MLLVFIYTEHIVAPIVAVNIVWEVIMNIAELLKIKETPKYKNMCIGNGVIYLQDACIVLDNICAMEILLPPALSPGFGIICVLAGILGCFAPVEAFRSIGIYTIPIGILSIILVIFLSSRRKYCLRIVLNSGFSCGFRNKDIKYMRMLLVDIQKAIGNPQIKFYADIAKKSIESVDNIYKYIGRLKKEVKVTIFGGNNIINNGSMGDLNGVTFGDNINGQTHTFNDDFSKQANETININNQTLTDEQWNVLIQFFAKRMQSLEPETQAYHSCSQMCETAKKKDASALKEEIKSAGKSVMGTILAAGVSTAVQHLLKLILHT